MAGFGESDVIRHDFPSTVIARLLSFVIEPFAVHFGALPAIPGGAANPASTSAARTMRPTHG
jgi:hypothetical protein